MLYENLRFSNFPYAPWQTTGKFASYREAAMRLIGTHFNFFAEGVESMMPWASIAYITLGTDDVKRAFAGLVALGDIGGLPMLKAILQKIVERKGLGDDMGALSSAFNAMRLES